MARSKRMSTLEQRVTQRLLATAMADPSPLRANRALDELIRRLLLLQHVIEVEGRNSQATIKRSMNRRAPRAGKGD
jgi:hypothetical protein